MSPSDSSLRTVEVRPPSVTAETLGVARAAIVVILGATFVIAAPKAPSSSAPRLELLQYQRLFTDLDSADQRTYRSLREAIVEAENVRGVTKQWPDVDALAREGIPPFAADPIDKAGYAWRRIQQGLSINYRGTPLPASGRPEFLVLFTEPDPAALRMPGEKPPPVDEQHHTLSDGTALHVSIWMHPSPAGPEGEVVSFPAAKGWMQVLTKPLDPTL